MPSQSHHMYTAVNTIYMARAKLKISYSSLTRQATTVRQWRPNVRRGATMCLATDQTTNWQHSKRLIQFGATMCLATDQTTNSIQFGAKILQCAGHMGLPCCTLPPPPRCREGIVFCLPSWTCDDMPHPIKCQNNHVQHSPLGPQPKTRTGSCSWRRSMSSKTRRKSGRPVDARNATSKHAQHQQHQQFGTIWFQNTEC